MKINLSERVEMGKMFPISGNIDLMMFVKKLVDKIRLTPEEVELLKKNENVEVEIDFAEDEKGLILACMNAHSKENSFSFFWLGLLEKFSKTEEKEKITKICEKKK